jgi:hypothetical protein
VLAPIERGPRATIGRLPTNIRIISSHTILKNHLIVFANDGFHLLVISMQISLL